MYNKGDADYFLVFIFAIYAVYKMCQVGMEEKLFRTLKNVAGLQVFMV